MIVFLVLATVWTVLLVLVVGACRIARLGDQAQHEQFLPAAYPPVPQASAGHRFTLHS
jgi:hypothetical protein